jgi:hypothetical protein
MYVAFMLLKDCKNDIIIQIKYHDNVTIIAEFSVNDVMKNIST